MGRRGETKGHQRAWTSFILKRMTYRKGDYHIDPRRTARTKNHYAVLCPFVAGNYVKGAFPFI